MNETVVTETKLCLYCNKTNTTQRVRKRNRLMWKEIPSKES